MPNRTAATTMLVITIEPSDSPDCWRRRSAAPSPADAPAPLPLPRALRLSLAPLPPPLPSRYPAPAPLPQLAQHHLAPMPSLLTLRPGPPLQGLSTRTMTTRCPALTLRIGRRRRQMRNSSRMAARSRRWRIGSCGWLTRPDGLHRPPMRSLEHCHQTRTGRSGSNGTNAACEAVA